MIKFVIYLFIMPIVIYAVDSININNFFKKNKIYQVRIFNVLIIFSLSYLICNFLYDFLYFVQ